MTKTAVSEPSSLAADLLQALSSAGMMGLLLPPSMMPAAAGHRRPR